MHTSQEILDSLNVDLAKEHAVIHQYEIRASQRRLEAERTEGC
jgi:hypothetical protein